MGVKQVDDQGLNLERLAESSRFFLAAGGGEDRMSLADQRSGDNRAQVAATDDEDLHGLGSTSGK